MSSRQRPARRLANLRAARRRRHSPVPPARLPAPCRTVEPEPPLELPERFADSVDLTATRARG